MIEPASHLDQIASRAQSLYSRPTVAMEVVRLAEQPSFDAEALKRCVEQDPALACKILRVVNSAMYGLNRPVTDLNQAIGLLGIKPLKLLVLGFNLPDALFAEIASRELQWYWTNTLTRAVAARLLSEQLWHQPGDEAFTAGLLQDIGILVLIRELGAPYARFLAGTIEEKCPLAPLEQDTLGFDHTQLSAALLARWQLPQRLVEAIATPKRFGRLSRMKSPDGDLLQILHLADLLSQLVGQQRLSLLPELLEVGKTYRGMTKQKLSSLVEGLQPQVDQLAEMLSLELSTERDYVQMLLEAHRAMSALGEQIAGEPRSEAADDRAHALLWTQTCELTEAMDNFLESGQHATDANAQNRLRPAAHAAHRRSGLRSAGDDATTWKGHSSPLLRAIFAAAKRCREIRGELSLLLLEPHVDTAQQDVDQQVACRQIQLALIQACSALDQENVMLMLVGTGRIAAILSNCERRTAVAVAHDAIAAFNKMALTGAGAIAEVATMISISVGVATAGVVPRNFDPQRLVDSAERCLSAARTCGISTVKSIEV
jgi:HD-like signal output (HDOD) protein